MVEYLATFTIELSLHFTSPSLIDIITGYLFTHLLSDLLASELLFLHISLAIGIYVLILITEIHVINYYGLS